MKPDKKRSPESLLAWAAAIIAREASSGTYGKVVVHMEKGVIARVTIEKSEVPEFTTE